MSCVRKCIQNIVQHLGTSQACAAKIDQLKLRSQYDAFIVKRKDEQMKERKAGSYERIRREDSEAMKQAKNDR